MGVKVATERVCSDEIREGSLGGRRDLSVVFAELRRNRGHVERLVDAVFGRAGDTVADTLTEYWIAEIYGVRATVTQAQGAFRVLVDG